MQGKRSGGALDKTIGTLPEKALKSGNGITSQKLYHITTNVRNTSQFVTAPKLALQQSTRLERADTSQFVTAPKPLGQIPPCKRTDKLTAIIHILLITPGRSYNECHEKADSFWYRFQARQGADQEKRSAREALRALFLPKNYRD